MRSALENWKIPDMEDFLVLEERYLNPKIKVFFLQRETIFILVYCAE